MCRTSIRISTWMLSNWKKSRAKVDHKGSWEGRHLAALLLGQEIAAQFVSEHQKNITQNLMLKKLFPSLAVLTFSVFSLSAIAQSAQKPAPANDSPASAVLATRPWEFGPVFQGVV